jgi:hypothetical protein
MFPRDARSVVPPAMAVKLAVTDYESAAVNIQPLRLLSEFARRGLWANPLGGSRPDNDPTTTWMHLHVIDRTAGDGQGLR